MVAPVDERHLDVDHWIAGEHAAAHGLLDAGVDRGDVLARDSAALDAALELVAGARFVGLDLDDHVTVLAAPAALADKAALDLVDLVAHRLAVGHLRLAHVGVDVELPYQPVDDDLEVELAHARDDRLPRLLVGVHAKGGVLFGEALQGIAELLLVGLGLGLDGHEDHRLGEVHGLEDDRLADLAERLAGGRVLEPHGGRQLAREDLVAVLAVVGVHLQDAADALALVFGGVEHVRAGLERAGVDAKVGELADVRVDGDLEGQRREGRVVVRRTRRLVAVGLEAHDRRYIERRRQEVDDGVHERLHALVLEGGAAQHRRDADVEGRPADHLAQVRGSDHTAFEIGLEQVVVVVGDGLDELEAVLVGPQPQLLGDVDDLEVGAQLVLVDQGLHLDEVDDAAELGLAADGDLQRHGVGPQAVDHHLEAAEEVGADAVHLVDESDTRDAVLVGLAPHRLRLGLHAADEAEERDGPIEHPQAALHLHGEVHVPGRVYDVDLRVAPGDGGRGGGDGDAALLLLRHPVHHGRALMDLTDLVRLTSIVQDALGGGRLAGVDVSHDADVARVLQRVLSHVPYLVPSMRKPLTDEGQ